MGLIHWHTVRYVYCTYVFLVVHLIVAVNHHTAKKIYGFIQCSVCTQSTFWAYNTFSTISTDGSASVRVCMCVCGYVLVILKFQASVKFKRIQCTQHTKRNLDGAYSTANNEKKPKQKAFTARFHVMNKSHLLMCADCGRVHTPHTHARTIERVNERSNAWHRILYENWHWSLDSLIISALPKCITICGDGNSVDVHWFAGRSHMDSIVIIMRHRSLRSILFHSTSFHLFIHLRLRCKSN